MAYIGRYFGYGRGYGQGYGRGYGPGYGRGYGPGYGSGWVDPAKCARFPWLDRWWWSTPGNVDVPDSEKKFLEGQVEALAKELEALKKRLGELSEEETK